MLTAVDDPGRDPVRDLLDEYGIVEFAAPSVIATWRRLAPIEVILRTIREVALVDSLEDHLVDDRMARLLMRTVARSPLQEVTR